MPRATNGGNSTKAKPFGYDFGSITGVGVGNVRSDFVSNNGNNGSRRHARQTLILPEDREFICWDGEGTNGTKGRNQNYSLFGCSTLQKIISPNLGTLECLKLVIKVAKANPAAFHVGFAFEYDTNMILRSMSPERFRELREKGSVIYNNYRLEHVPSKWIQITEYGPQYREGNKNDKFTVRIADIFGFFQCSFVKACESYIPDSPLMARLDALKEGKDKRASFEYEDIEYITAYWTVEIQLLKELVERLREMLYRVDLRITRWHGPGALANYTYKARGILAHKSLTPWEVRNAARFGYAGGRFELYRLGRHQQVWGIDINSAYPAAISRLPSLAEGRWIRRDGSDIHSVVEFGIYHVRMRGFAGPIKKPSPLFHRDAAHNISYPWITEGWYWSPEIVACLPLLARDGFEIVEGYEYVDWESRPFQFVEGMYNKRRALKKAEDGAEKALKLALNSLYGKMAQRVGWERTGRPPTWHQLEWAGYVTSAARAKLYAVMARIPWEHLIAVETDAIYTTFDPERLGIRDSTKLGEWETSYYDELLYVQSGVYFGRQGDKWKNKYRGLDKDTLNEQFAVEYLKGLHPNPTAENPWEAIKGPTTRFIGYANALHREDSNMGPFKVHHARWETTPRELTTGQQGKRRHSPKVCAACQVGATAYEMPHDLVIQSASTRTPMSERHSIPWEEKDNADTAEWRKKAREEEGLIYNV